MTITDLIDEGCTLFQHKDAGATTCLLGIGDIIKWLIASGEVDECTHANGTGAVKAAIKKLAPLWAERGHDYSERYYTAAHRAANILTKKQVQIARRQNVPFRDLHHICSQHFSRDSRKKLFNEIEAKGWKPFHNMARKFEEAQKSQKQEKEVRNDIVIQVPIEAHQITEAFMRVLEKLEQQGIKREAAQVYLDEAMNRKYRQDRGEVAR